MAPLCRHFNVAVMQMASRLFPTGYDTGPDAPTTLDRMLVWDGASDKTIFGSPEINHDNRAWHDWTHWRYDLPFTVEGERAVVAIMQSDLRKVYRGHNMLDYWCSLIDADVMGTVLYEKHYSRFPDNQVVAVLAHLAGGMASATA